MREFLKENGPIIFGVGVILLILALLMALMVILQAIEAEQMKTCLELGGSWTGKSCWGGK